jgi:spermidine synthase
MIDCTHYSSHPNPLLASCGNFADMLHDGMVPIATCHVCPFRQPERIQGAGDLVERGLSAVGITQQRVQKLARAVGVKDCGCRKRKAALNRLLPFAENSDSGPSVPSTDITFVWPYWAAGAKHDELRWSMRSVRQFYRGQADLIVVGDRPSWFAGRVIEQPRVRSQRYRSFRDMLAKMQTMAQHPDIPDEFVWMMDDVYFIKPVGLHDLKVPRVSGMLPESAGNSGWQKLKVASRKLLTQAGMPCYDYATHLPHYVNKQKLAAVFAAFPTDKQTYLWEIVYGNMHRSNPVSWTPFFRRLTSAPASAAELTRTTARASVINHVDAAWSPVLRTWLGNLLPQPLQHETESLPMQQPFRTQHILLIQSAYRADQALSRQRLELSKTTIIPSLQAQTVKATVQVSVSRHDPLLEQRRQAFRECGHDVQFVWQDQWDLPDGRLLVGRCDDDDVISKDFFEGSLFAAERGGPTPFAVIWPNGHVRWKAGLFESHHPGNQFVALCTDDRHHPFQMDHRRYTREWRNVTAGHDPAWIWIRHADAMTQTRRRYRRKRLKRLNTNRFPYNFRAIHRVIVSRLSLDQIAQMHGTDKCSEAHNYTAVYAELLNPVRNEPLRILELGVQDGASIRTWCDFFPRATVVGVDTAKAPQKYPRYTHLQQDAVDPLPGQPGSFDLIIDDASHKSSEQMASLLQHAHRLKPGGLYVIEDVGIQASPTFMKHYADTTPTFLEHCIQWQKSPASIPVAGFESCQLHNQQLAVLRKSQTAPETAATPAPAAAPTSASARALNTADDVISP